MTGRATKDQPESTKARVSPLTKLLARRYERAWLPGDLLAGLAITALLIPQGIAYAELAGLPPVAGLYASLVPLIVYALVGPSRILILGPDSALAPLVAAAVIPLAGADMAERVALASLLAVLVGGLLLVGALARLGLLTDLLSKPVRNGYLSGVAVLVITEQLPSLLGYGVSGGHFLDDLSGLVRGLDEIDLVSTGLGLLALAVIAGGRRLNPAVPGVLIAVIAATVLVKGFDLTVDVIGPVPGGLPSPGLPSPSAVDLGRLTLSGLAIALLAFADTSVLSRSYSSRLGDNVDQNRELSALGWANIATGFLQGFPVSSSSSRTPVAEAAGAHTQLTGVVAALGIGVVLVAGTDLLRDIPQPVIAAVVISAVLRLIDLRVYQWLFQVNKGDFALAVSSLLGVAIYGVLPGVGIAVGLSVLAVLERAWHPYTAALGRVTGLKGYHDLVRHPEARQIPGLILFRFDAPLFFANTEVFRDGVNRAIASVQQPRRVVVAAEPITDVDSTAAEMLAELPGELERQGISLAFAEMKGPVKDQLRRYGIFERIGEEHFYPTIGLAVRSYVQDYGVEWHDWEEDEP